MVKQVGGIFQCEECKLFYKEKSIAEKCQAWCKKHKSCNIEIIKYSVSAKLTV